RIAFLKAARAELAVDRLATPALPPPPALRPRERATEQQAIKGYQLRESIGAGGFGAVYRATQPGVGREVAIKVILPTYANHPDFIRRFEAEAQLVARLEHPHIVPLYDYWRESGGAYLVMRFIRAGSLQAALHAGPWTLERSTRLLGQVASALAFAHRHGVVHRDLKPANILLDEDGHAYLADFGIAKEFLIADEVAQTQPEAVVGSPDYLSPEQIRAEPITPQTDLYGLGVLLYELLTGVQPFAALSPSERLYKQLHATLPPLDKRRPDLPAALDTVIQRATAKQPLDRYPDVASLVVAWQQALAPTGALLAWPESPTEITPLNSEQAHHSSAPASVEDLTISQFAAVENPYKGLRAFGEADAADF
ncbi:MAG TPA: serine/threonine-protein kinase, partial [Roseiflexaceae bacterium]|nr:serine/threonine-protein kinase [Roseiflexaceae bacterium]